MPQSRWYPTTAQLGDPSSLERAFRQTLKQQYEHADSLAAVAGKVNAPAPAAPAAAPETNGPTNTKMLGLNVTPIDTNSTPLGSIPTYVPSSGQITFMTPAGAVPAPATDTSPGFPGQIAFDATHVYICIAINTWRRTTIGSF
jgi:hypothetical protein